MSFVRLLWEHDKFQCQWSNMAHTSFTNRTRSLSVPRDYSGDGVVYKQPEVIPTRNTPKHLPHPTGAMLWHRASSRGFPASYEFSRIQNGWIKHGAEVILPPGGWACPSLVCKRPTHVVKTSHRTLHAASGHDFMCHLADLQFPAPKP